MDGRHPRRRAWRRLTPRAGARAQLLAAAVVWLVGTTILLVRGVAYIAAPDEYARLGYGIVVLALVGVAAGVVKARFVLIRHAEKAVTRIRTRGHACFFGLFAWSSWVFIILMMGGGLLLRHSPLVDSWWGRSFLGVLYVAVGTALAIADVIFWRAALGRLDAPARQPSPSGWASDAAGDEARLKAESSRSDQGTAF